MASVETPSAALARGDRTNQFLAVEDLDLAVGLCGSLQDYVMKRRRAGDRSALRRIDPHCRRIGLVGIDCDGEGLRRNTGAGGIRISCGQTMVAVSQLRSV